MPADQVKPWPYRPWTAAEDKQVRTLSINEAAKVLNRSRNAIEIRRRKLGVAPGRKPVRKQVHKKRVGLTFLRVSLKLAAEINKRARTEPPSELVKEYGMSYASIRRIKRTEPEQIRRARIAESKRGKPRPPHVIEAMRMGRTGKPHPPEVKAKLAARGRERLLASPINGRTWTAEEDEMVRTLLPTKVLKRTGRTLASIYSRRDRLNGKR